jgi:hypothetical protein
MKTLKVLLGAVALALISQAANAATPSPIATPAATQTPVAAATAASTLKKNVGTSAAFLKFIAAGTCVVDISSLAEGNSAVYTCSVADAQTGDFASVTRVFSNSASENVSLKRDCFYVDGAAVVANGAVTFRLTNRDNGALAQACNPPDTTFQYLVLRPNNLY